MLAQWDEYLQKHTDISAAVYFCRILKRVRDRHKELPQKKYGKSISKQGWDDQCHIRIQPAEHSEYDKLRDHDYNGRNHHAG